MTSSPVNQQHINATSHLDLLALANLQQGDIAIDCGANRGTITQIMASTGATVYAFEPNPYVYALLEKRFTNTQNVICINKGVLDHEGTVQLYLHHNADEDQVKWATGCSVFAHKTNVNPENSVEIEVVDLAHFIKQLNAPVKLLKMDIEGPECLIINKLIDSGVIRNIDHMVVETHEKGVPEMQVDIDMLKQRIIKEKLANLNLEWT